MDTQTLFVIIAVFTGISALALVIHAATLIAIYKASRAAQGSMDKLSGRMETLASKVEAIADSSLAAVAEVKANIAQLTAKSTTILDSANRQVARIEEMVNDATDRARNQMDRAELVVDDAMTRAHETLAIVHSGVMRPLREINGVTQGVRAAFHYLLRGGRPTPDEATADEEMFI